MDQLYTRVESVLRAVTLLLGTWALYSQIGVLARVPFATLRTFSFAPLLAALLLFRLTTRRVQPFENSTASDRGTLLRWLFASPAFRFGGPLAAAIVFFFTKSEWLFWIPAAILLTIEVWTAPVAPVSHQVSRPSGSARVEAAVLAGLCLVAAAATAGLMRPDIDDAYYVNVATSVNEFPERAPLSFDAMHRSGLPPVEETLHLPQTYEVLIGLISSLSSASVPTLYYVVFPTLWAILGTLVHWLILRHLLPRREALLATAVWIFIILFWGDGLRSFGNFGFARIYQGKAVFLVVVIPLVVLAALRYRQQPGLTSWICLALSQSAASTLTTNAIVIAPLTAGLVLIASPRLDRQFARTLAGGLAASAPLLVVAALMHARLSPFLTTEDPDPYFRPYLTTLGATRAPLVLLAILTLPALAARARLACAGWIRSYVWFAVVMVFVPLASAAATEALGNVFSWRIFWCVPVPLLVSLAGGIALGAIFERRWLPEGAVAGWLLAFAIAAPPTFFDGGWSVRHFGRIKVVEARYSAARATISLARTDAPALVTEAVAMYVVGLPGAPPLIGVRRLYLRKLWHLIPDAELARRLELLAYVARGDRGMALGDELEDITRKVGGDPNLPFEVAMHGIDAGGIATVVVRDDHPDLDRLMSALAQRGFVIHRVSGFVVAAQPRAGSREGA